MCHALTLTRREDEFPVGPANGIGSDASVEDGRGGEEGIQGARLVGQVLKMSSLQQFVLKVSEY